MLPVFFVVFLNVGMLGRSRLTVVMIYKLNYNVKELIVIL